MGLRARILLRADDGEDNTRLAAALQIGAKTVAKAAVKAPAKTVAKVAVKAPARVATKAPARTAAKKAPVRRVAAKA